MRAHAHTQSDLFVPLLESGFLVLVCAPAWDQELLAQAVPELFCRVGPGATYLIFAEWLALKMKRTTLAVLMACVSMRRGQFVNGNIPHSVPLQLARPGFACSRPRHFIESTRTTGLFHGLTSVAHILAPCSYACLGCTGVPVNAFFEPISRICSCWRRLEIATQPARHLRTAHPSPNQRVAALRWRYNCMPQRQMEEHSWAATGLQQTGADLGDMQAGLHAHAWEAQASLRRLLAWEPR